MIRYPGLLDLKNIIACKYFFMCSERGEGEEEGRNIESLVYLQILLRFTTINANYTTFFSTLVMKKLFPFNFETQGNFPLLQ